MYNKPQQNTYKSNKDELSEGGESNTCSDTKK